MTIFNLGSINIDHVYLLPHLPRPGETLAATDYSLGLGGKGANQSVAAARAGARVFHIGALGNDATWPLDELRRFGVDTTHVKELDTPTGHAIIQVDPQAENVITLFPGANRQITPQHITAALSLAVQGDILLLQNETSAQVTAAHLATAKAMRTLYTPAPFSLSALREVIEHTSILLMNEGEASAMRDGLGSLPACEVIITKGANGAEWHRPGHDPIHVLAYPVAAVDTTGAGDCFAGNIAAALDEGLSSEQALRRASAAAAIQVTRAGAANAMPTRAEVDDFLRHQSR